MTHAQLLSVQKTTRYHEFPLRAVNSLNPVLLGKGPIYQYWRKIKERYYIV